jgi:hypothetical protein
MSAHWPVNDGEDRSAIIRAGGKESNTGRSGRSADIVDY